MFKKLFIIFLLLTSITMPYIGENNTVNASALIDEKDIVRAVTLVSTEKLPNSTKYTYKIEGLKINDNPKQFGGYSIQDLYQMGASNTTIANNLDKLYFSKVENTNVYATHTGWTVVRNVFSNGEWVSKEQSTDDGYAGKTYRYDQVTEGIAEMQPYLDSQSRAALENADKTNAIFTVIGDSRNQRVRKFPTDKTNPSSTAFYYPASARTNPQEGDLFYIYYDNNVYVDVLVYLEVPDTKIPECDYSVTATDTTLMNQNVLNPNPSGRIFSSTGEFDVEDGIPTSEDLIRKIFI